jgi:hypothetical protein
VAEQEWPRPLTNVWALIDGSARHVMYVKPLHARKGYLVYPLGASYTKIVDEIFRTRDEAEAAKEAFR